MNSDALKKRLARLKELMNPEGPPVIRCIWGNETLEAAQPGERILVTKWGLLELDDDLDTTDDEESTS